MRMFFAICAAMGYYIRAGDVQNCFQTTDGHEVRTYLKVDETYAEWYEDRFGEKLDRSMVLPIEKALQGHPLSGALWEKRITEILTGPELNLRSTTHEQNLYQGLYNGETIFIC